MLNGLNEHWTVARRSGLLYLQCLPFLEFDWAAHGFSLRTDEAGVEFDLGRTAAADDPVVQARRRRFLAGMGLESTTLVLLEQVHGDRVAILGSLERRTGVAAPLVIPSADGAVSGEPGLALSIRYADCAAILLLDPAARIVAAVHAGWRGAAAGIAARAVEKMSSLGAEPRRILAAIGPAIGPCCYTVGKDVAARVPEEARPAVLQGLPGDLRLDLVGLNRWWLREAGLLPENVFPSGQCTHCRPDLFHSHRREGRAAGRMMAAIARLR
ncbi:MAG: peptidoglycan editing factor PgeF [Firmicutes bacterium]|nr:peptidoglycan editing factor PgeF [Bacillota bacterium]